MNARIALPGGEVRIDLAHPVSLALTLDFDGPQPRHFGAPRASARPFEAPGFSGAVASGASCNCAVITLVPHCQGTHTESVGPPYLSREAAQLLVTRGILHLIVDVPSLDRTHDDGRLTAHRIFFGLPPDSAQLGAATRPDATVTEFAFAPDTLPDDAYLLELQVPALAGDAVPSRPLLYPLLSPASP